MNILVLMASPRKNGDTATLLKSFLTELEMKRQNLRRFSYMTVDLERKF